MNEKVSWEIKRPVGSTPESYHAGSKRTSGTRHRAEYSVHVPMKCMQSRQINRQLTFDFTGLLFLLRPPFLTSGPFSSLDPELRFMPRLRLLRWLTSLPLIARTLAGGL